MRRHIVLATHNQGKIEEMRALLADLPLRVWPAPPSFEVEETGLTFADNARLKALALARLWPSLAESAVPAGEAWFLADDSGLEVDALQGAPGIYSARYGGLATAAERNSHLLRELLGVPEDRRHAHFTCALALADHQEIRFVAAGQCPGKVAFVGRGAQGFGYDPLFIPDGFWRTMAELTPAEKNDISHRGLAMAQLRRFLREHAPAPRPAAEGIADARQ